MSKPGDKPAKQSWRSRKSLEGSPVKSDADTFSDPEQSRFEPSQLPGSESPQSSPRQFGSPRGLGASMGGRGPMRPNPGAKPKAKPKAKSRTSAEDITSLKNVWDNLLGDTASQSEMDHKDFARALKKGGVNGVVDSKTFPQMIQEEMGSGSSGKVTFDTFSDCMLRYFSDCNPTEECGEIWELVGGGPGGKTNRRGDGSLQPEDLCNALNRFGITCTRAEAEDMVLYATCGNNDMSYQDFVENYLFEAQMKR